MRERIIVTKGERERPLEEIKREMLDEHIHLGPAKPVSYIPLETIQDFLGLTLDQYKALVDRPGNCVLQFADDECCIHSGAIYAYHHESLERVLAGHAGTLREQGWPTTPEAFVRRLGAEFVDDLDSPLAPILREAFGEPDWRAIALAKG